MFQIFRQFTRKTPYQPFLLPFSTASFATSAKNKVIRNKNPSREDISESPSIDDSIQEFSPTSALRSRYVYSEKDQKVKEIISAKNEALTESSSLARAEKVDLENFEEADEADLGEFERLSKRLSRLGVCSRRQAEKLIQSGIVKVNNKTVLSNVPVAENDKISVFTKHGEKIPMKEDTKIWVFRKPRGLICTHNDPQGRETIFEYLREQGFKDEHFISVGRLDYLSEGLILLTNDGELAQSLEQPHSNIERTYRVRVFGRFDEDKLNRIRKGVTIKGIQYGPYWVEIEKRQTRNTWLKMRMTTGKNREIRKVMQKFSLRVDRIQRTKYGPYTLEGMENGTWAEVPITPEVKRVAYMGLRKRLEQKQMEYTAALQLAQSQAPEKPQLPEHKPAKQPQLQKADSEIKPKRLSPRARIVVKKLPAGEKVKI